MSSEINDDIVDELLAGEVGEFMNDFTADVFAVSQGLVPVRTGVLKASGHADRDSETEWSVTYDADYAIDVEMGHRIVDREGRDTGKVQPPQAFLRPALDQAIRDRR